MKIYTVTSEQIDNMKHAIGFVQDLAKGTKHRKYQPYRNYFTTPGDNASWDNLVEQGLAEKRDFPQGGAASKIYFVTKDGFKFLTNILDITIMEDQA